MRSAFLWRRLIGATIEHPDSCIDQAHELCLAKPLLIGPDTVYEMGQLVAVFAGKFSVQQREAVETCIIALAETPDESAISQIKHRTAISVRHAGGLRVSQNHVVLLYPRAHAKGTRREDRALSSSAMNSAPAIP